MNNRYIGALILAPLVIFLFLGGEYLKYIVMVLSLLGMYEFYKVSRKKHYKPIGHYRIYFMYSILLKYGQ